MIRTALIAVATLLAIVSGALAPVVSAQRPAAPVVVPIELAARHVIVKVSVNKSKPLSFVLDTGANPAIVTLTAAKALGLTLHGSVASGGAGAETQVGSRVNGATWSLIGLDSFAQPLSFAVPLPTLSSAMGRTIDGIIGGEFIRQFVVELDYQARTMTLHDRASFSYNGRGETLPIELNANGHPVVSAAITLLNGTTLERKFILDIGSGLALALHSPFVSEHGLPEPESKTIRAIGAAGAGGRSVGKLGRVASLQLGKFTIKSPIVLFSEDTAGAFADATQAGNIGAQIVSRFRVFLDYGRRRIVLEPSTGFDAPFDRAFSGISLRAEGEDYRTFRVHEVLEHSPAAEAGITAGDIITAINGTPARDLTLTALGEMFEKSVPYELTIQRGEQMLKVSVTPRPLI
jgi:PDZ domain/Aspartyl protease